MAGFSEGVRATFKCAQEQARLWNHEYIGTEHVLIALMMQGDNATILLSRFGVYSHQVIEAIKKLMQPGPSAVTMGKIPQTPRVKHAIETASNYAQSRGFGIVSERHLLFALADESEAVSGQVLANLGVHPADLHEEIVKTEAADFDTIKRMMQAEAFAPIFNMPVVEVKADTITLPVPQGSREVSAMEVVEQALKRMLPTDSPVQGRERQHNYEARDRVVRWLADKYSFKG
jgi:ATP-dependent Clp protease ATP-binding subunit ClpA